MNFVLTGTPGLLAHLHRLRRAIEPHGVPITDQRRVSEARAVRLDGKTGKLNEQPGGGTDRTDKIAST